MVYGIEDGQPTYWLTRFVILRLLGLVYAIAFVAAINQIIPLIGSDGLLPVGTFLRRVSEPPALIGMVASMLVMCYIRFWTPIAWTWYVLIGSLVTLLVAWIAGFFFAPASSERRDELSPTG